MTDLAVPLSPYVVRPILDLAALAAVFALKHYVADFVLQTNWIAHGKERAQDWLLPLLAHAAVHGAMTLAIALVVKPSAWWLALFDVAVHVVVDRGKTLAARRGGWQPNQPQFWWLLGFDQLLHQLTNVGMATVLILL